MSSADEKPAPVLQEETGTREGETGVRDALLGLLAATAGYVVDREPLRGNDLRRLDELLSARADGHVALRVSPPVETGDGRELREWFLFGSLTTTSAGPPTTVVLEGPVLASCERIRVREVPDPSSSKRSPAGQHPAEADLTKRLAREAAPSSSTTTNGADDA